MLMKRLEVTGKGALRRQAFEVLTFTEDGRVELHRVAACHAEDAIRQAKAARAEMEGVGPSGVHVYGTMPLDAF